MLIDMNVIKCVAIISSVFALDITLLGPILDIFGNLIDSYIEIPRGRRRAKLAILAGIKIFALFSTFFFVISVTLAVLFSVLGIS